MTQSAPVLPCRHVWRNNRLGVGVPFSATLARRKCDDIT
jgi:hypothetical protein